MHYASFSPEIKEGKKHVACIGDSITFGYGVWGKRKEEAFPVLLEKLFDDEYQFVNYGLPGRCLLFDSTEPFIKEDYYPLSLYLKADIYLILLGTNDGCSFNWNIEDNDEGEIFRENLRKFTSSYLALDNKPQVILMTPPDALDADDEDQLVLLRHNLRKYIRPIIYEIGKELNVPVIDLYEITKEKKELFDDGIHPNTLGNKVIAEHIYQEMKKIIYSK